MIKLSPSVLTPLTVLLCLFMTLCLGWANATDNISEQKLFADFRAGTHIALMRHALAPGTGDPENFKLEDCSTQRNLSPAGRDQAVRIGTKFQQAGITDANVYTSQWCRCRETAELLGLGTPEPLPPLNSFFREYQKKDQQTAELRNWLSTQKLEKPLILVTHQVNITAFSGIFPDSGEVVLMRRNADGQFDVVGTVQTE